MSNAYPLPPPRNEPVLPYLPGAPESRELAAQIAHLSSKPTEIRVIVGGQSRGTPTVEIRAPHRHDLLLARAAAATAADAHDAIDAALAAAPAWGALPLTERAAIFLRAADLLAGPRRAKINAATVLGQSKTPHQAEIDAACELIDFWRFNVHFAERITTGEQPRSPHGAWNRLDFRPLEGFVYAVTPFNFTSIAGNLPTAPALMGCTVVWKPAPGGLLAAHAVYGVLREAGLPDGVINFVPGPPAEISEVVLGHPSFAGLHFTGSTAVFQTLWQQTALHLPRYKSFPRLVGETGGKDFIVAHPSAGQSDDDLDALVTAIVRGGYEFQGQKCSAASRVYLPRSLWPALEERLAATIAELPVGDPADHKTFVGAVIDERAFDKIRGYVELAKAGPGTRIVAGGRCDKTHGWFIHPTLVESTDPTSRLMTEEIFGPVVTVHVFDDARFADTLALIDQSTPYALTGAVFARDRGAIATVESALRNAAGNFYINDKPTGAVVGQQPFGGARRSGTNDKAGSALNLLRWVSPRTIKETFVPATSWRYPYLGH